MTLNKTRFTFRIDDNNLDKIKVIAEKSRRSVNAQIEYILEQYIEEYEKQHGEIKVKKQ